MKCIIVNDDNLMKNSLLKLINQSGDLNLISVFSSIAEAEVFLCHQQVDVIFFDIQMDDVKNLEFLNKIPDDIFVIYIPVFSPFVYYNEKVSGKSVEPSQIAKRFRRGIEKAKGYINIFRYERKTGFEDYFVI
ncbi:response regulator [Chryseobacterium daeguense]|uniref:response regulator n=1 Tax=Chryseobacterium daeguense TaxID=412438 RepID=UPI00040473CB|nr:response regulator [Chryseobacterium daeguense]